MTNIFTATVLVVILIMSTIVVLVNTRVHQRDAQLVVLQAKHDRYKEVVEGGGLWEFCREIAIECMEANHEEACR